MKKKEENKGKNEEKKKEIDMSWCRTAPNLTNRSSL